MNTSTNEPQLTVPSSSGPSSAIPFEVIYHGKTGQALRLEHMSIVVKGLNFLWYLGLLANLVWFDRGFPNTYDVELIHFLGSMNNLDRVKVMMARSMVMVHHYK